MNFWHKLFPKRCFNCGRRLQSHQIILVRLVGETKNETCCQPCLITNRFNLDPIGG